jgi:Bifunctional DNA primase/polymerase, N-terminal/AAA domain
VSTEPNEFLEAALQYCERGFACLPLHPGQKKPIAEEWQNQPKPDAQALRDWWATAPKANVGIRVGAISGVFVVDVDPRNGGEDSFEQLVHRYGQLPYTLTVATGGGGRHYYFQLPADGPVQSIPNLFPGLEIKASGQVVAPPSIHPDTGRLYDWDGLRTFTDTPIAEAPGWLLKLIREHRPAAVNGKAGAVDCDQIQVGQRHITLVRHAGVLRNAGWTAGEILDGLVVMNRRCVEPLSDDELRVMAASFNHYEKGKLYAGIRTGAGKGATPRSEDDSGRGEGDSESAGSRIINVSDLELDGDADDEEGFLYIQEPEIPERSLVALTGDSGVGKSTLAHAWIRNALERETPCLILDRENPRPLRRLERRRIGLKDHPLLSWWTLEQIEEAPSPTDPRIIDWVKQQVVSGTKPLVMVDSVSAFLDGQNENDAAVIRVFMDGLRKLVALGASVICIHHTGKSESSKDYRGSSDFKANLDQGFLVLNFSADAGKLDRQTLKPFKSRYGLSGEIVYHYAGGKFVRDTSEFAGTRTVTDSLISLLKANPGVGTRRFFELASKAGLGRNSGQNFLNDGLVEGSIRREQGARREWRHWLKETP